MDRRSRRTTLGHDSLADPPIEQPRIRLRSLLIYPATLVTSSRYSSCQCRDWNYRTVLQNGSVLHIPVGKDKNPCILKHRVAGLHGAISKKCTRVLFDLTKHHSGGPFADGRGRLRSLRLRHFDITTRSGLTLRGKFRWRLYGSSRL